MNESLAGPALAPAEAASGEHDARVLALRTLSPLHLGGREPLPSAVGGDAIGLVRPPGEAWAYAVDPDKLLPALKQRGGLELVAAWADHLADWGRRGSRPAPGPERFAGALQAFLAEKQLLRRDLAREVSVARMPAPAAFQPFVRDGRDRAYVPGSALKGAIRTALLWHRLRTGAAGLDLEAHLAERLAWWREQAGKGRAWLARTGLSLFLVEKAFGGRGPGREAPQRDFLRALRVSDSEPLPAAPILSEVGAVSLREGAPYLKQTYRSVELAEGRVRVRLAVDRELLGRLSKDAGFDSVDGLLAIVAGFGKALWEHEAAFVEGVPRGAGNLESIQRFYARPPEGCVFRLGWGGGLLATTAALLLAPASRAKLRDEVVSQGRHRRAPEDGPKSRRYFLDRGRPAAPLGWVLLEPESAEPGAVGDSEPGAPRMESKAWLRPMEDESGGREDRGRGGSDGRRDDGRGRGGPGRGPGRDGRREGGRGPSRSRAPALPVNRPGARVKGRIIADPKDKGRLWAETIDGLFSGRVLEGGTPGGTEPGAEVELMIHSIQGKEGANFCWPDAPIAPKPAPPGGDRGRRGGPGGPGGFGGRGGR